MSAFQVLPDMMVHKKEYDADCIKINVVLCERLPKSCRMKQKTQFGTDCLTLAWSIDTSGNVVLLGIDSSVTATDMITIETNFILGAVDV